MTTFSTSRPTLRAMRFSEPLPPSHPLIEPTLFYAPPYERPVEDEFAWHLVKYLTPVSALDYQVRVDTPCLPVWVDFVIELGGRRIGFECGEIDPQAEDADELAYRDALVVGSGGVDVLYRLRGGDLLHRLHDVLFALAQWEPQLFSERGRLNLHTLASAPARACRPGASDTEVRIEQPPIDEAADWPTPEDWAPEIVVLRRRHDQPNTWLDTYEAALTHYGVDPEAWPQRA